MINSKIFFKGLKSLIGVRSPAIPLAACFVALGALLKDAGLNDGEILEANQIICYFNYVNRSINGLGVSTKGDIVGYYKK